MEKLRKVFLFIDSTSKDDFLFHGFNSIEALIKLLKEHGIDEDEEHLRKCVDIIFEKSIEDSFYEKGISKVGRILEEKGHSGSKTIRAASLLFANREFQSIVKNEIEHSLKCFFAVQDYQSIDDFTYEKNGKLVFKEGKLFPDYYNLRLLSRVILFPQQGHGNSPRGTCIVTTPSEAAVKQLNPRFDFLTFLPSGTNGQR